MATKRALRSGTVTLKPVDVSDDGTYLVLAQRANAKGGGFRLAIDEALLRALDAARDKINAGGGSKPVRAPASTMDQPPARVESRLSVKEIQSLLRQGRSVASVAMRAGVPPAWIERFEPPIAWERSGMATRAQRLTLVRPRRGDSALPLGESVAVNLKARGIVMTSEQVASAWDSTRRRSSRWVVTFSFSSRGRQQVCEWELDPEANTVHPLNKAAAEIGWVAPRRRGSAAS